MREKINMKFTQGSKAVHKFDNKVGDMCKLI